MPAPSTIVIAGASAGVGRATAAAFARRGARIGLIAREQEALLDTADEVARLGGSALVLPLDVADARAVRDAADRVERELGPIDVWINAAMATVFSPVRKLSAEEIRRVTEVTYLGSVHGVLAAVAHMRRRNRGTILQVGSALAYRGIPLQAAYCGAKFAIRGFLESLRSELISEGSGVRICIVQLPAVNTPQFDWARTQMPRQPRPVPPVFQPEAVAEALVAAAIEGRREFWLGWSSMKAIIGAQLMPQFLDGYLARHAITGQLDDEPVAPDRIDNLDAAAPVDLHRASGRFRDEARPHAVLLNPTTVRRAIIGAGLATAAAVGAGLVMVAGTARRSRRASVGKLRIGDAALARRVAS
jgi:short-subunit dehydrogenase